MRAARLAVRAILRRTNSATRQALALASELGMRPLIAHCHLGLGKLYWRSGERQEAHEHFGTANTMCRETDVRFWLDQAQAEMKVMA